MDKHARYRLLIVAALLVGAGGCATPDRPAATTTSSRAAATPGRSAGPDAAPALAAALRSVDGQSLRLILTARGGDLECDYETDNRGYSCAGDTRDGALDMVSLGADLYLRIPHTGARFLRYSVAKLPARPDLLVLLDPMFLRRVLDAATGVHPGAAGTITGTVDLTRAGAALTGVDKRLAEALAARAGAAASAVPFTATLDASGRLAGLRATFPAATKADEFGYAVKINEIGATVTVVPPARDRWTDAPASAYK